MQIVIGESKEFPNIRYLKSEYILVFYCDFSFCKIPFLSDIEKSDIQPTLVQTHQTGQLPRTGIYLTFRLMYSFGINRVLPLVPARQVMVQG